MNTNGYHTLYEIDGLHTFDDATLSSKNIRIISRDGNIIKLFFDHKSYDAVIKNFDSQTKRAWINVSGFDFRIKINEPLDQLINELGFLKAAKHSVKEIKSPMPGMVVDIFVSVGDAVKEGDKLLTLEAMKMENILKSPGDGVIKNIKIKKSQTIDKNQVLIEFE